MSPEKAQEIAGAMVRYADLERRMLAEDTPRDQLPGLVHGWIAAGQYVRSLLAEAR